MQAILLDLLAGLLRHMLTGVSAWLITNGILKPEQINQLIIGIALALVSAGLLVWHKYKNRILINTSAAKPAGTPVADIKKDIAAGNSVPATVPENVAPRMPN